MKPLVEFWNSIGTLADAPGSSVPVETSTYGFPSWSPLKFIRELSCWSDHEITCAFALLAWISCRFQTRMGSRLREAMACTAARAPLMVVMQGIR